MEDQELGIEKLEGLLGSLGDLVVAGKVVMADGKINMADLPVAIGLLSDIGDIIEGLKDLGGAVKEAKDLDSNEVHKIIDKVYEVVGRIEAA